MRFIPIFLFILISNILFAQDSLVIGFSLGDFSVDRWIKDKDYFKKEANKEGAKVLFEYAYGDPDQQIEQSKKLVDEQVKVLIVVPTDAEKSAEIVTYAHQKNVIVIAYDRLIKNCDLDCYISFDNVKVGELQAEYALKRQPKGNYVLLAGPTSDNNAKLFHEGQMKVLKPAVDRGDIHIILDKNMPEWASIPAFQEIQNLLNDQNADIDAIIASNDQFAGGSVMALDMNDIDKKIIITGQDATLEACLNLIAGKQSMTVYKPIKLLARSAAEEAVKLARGELSSAINGKINNGSIDVPSILLEPISVDTANMNETVVADGFIYSGELPSKQ